jgi:hypothetical protein
MIGTATSAAAATCSGVDTCLYYNSNGQGATAGFDGNIPDYAGYTFDNDGNGGGLAVKNDAASATNNFLYSPQYIYYNSNWQGPDQAISPYDAWDNLNSTLKNENASQWAVAET